MINLIRRSLHNIIYCIILVTMIIGSANAETVEYEVYNPYETNNGTTIEDFSDISKFTHQVYTSIEMYEDNVNTTDGNGAIKLEVDRAYRQSAWMLRTFDQPIDLSDAENIFVSFYVHGNAASLYQFKIALSSTTESNTYITDHVNVTFRQGWNVLVIDTDDFVNSATEQFENPIVNMYVYVYPTSGYGVVPVSFDRVAYNYSGQPTVLFTFDDSSSTVYDLAYPIMQERGIQGTIFVVTDWDEENVNTLSELHELKSVGWDISSHTKTHANLATTTNNLTTELRGSQLWLQDNGFGKSSLCIAYPYGGIDDEAMTEIQKYYLIGRTIKKSSNEPHIQEISTDYQYTLKHVYPTIDVSTDYINASIDDCIAQNGMCILTFHSLNPEYTGYEYSYTVENFTKICDYVAAHSEIQPVVMSSYIRPVLDSGVTIIGDTVQINNSGIVTRLTESSMPGVYSDMIVTPSSDTVNVTVLTWTEDQKVWTESSDTSQSVTHTIGGFTPNKVVWIYRDGTRYDHVASNSTGYITWVYSGGFSTHTFSTEEETDAIIADNTINRFLEAFVLGVLSIFVFAAVMLIAIVKGSNIDIVEMTISVIVASLIVGVGAIIILHL